ncbi:MAG: inositol monophosphatase family protein [Desulfobacterales bacterium]|nr:inositol monophosphatase family protein [Desulfobacterales bacterium]MDD4071218.1 inositol monophosphatase family protein [Desulfobacterales bacterium]MDD4392226.1 inositol monophosphatase family protein [Desulfobacterales bacterium]
MDLDLIKKIGVEAACQGAEILLSHFGNLSHIHKKGAIDLVTEADLGSEQAIIKTIRTHFPDHAILAEESGMNEGKSDVRWIIDPLDGTTNYAHRLGQFAISIACTSGADIVAGIVLNPVTEELFTALRGRGAMLNGRPVRVSDTCGIEDSLLVTGFPYNLKDIFPGLIERFANCLKASQGVRRMGSAALDLCFVACGRFEGFWEQNLKAWDTAAGTLIAREAGAFVTDFSGIPFTVDRNEIVATNGKIHKQLLALL